MSKWPAWFYGPEGQSAIFETQSEVPDGWTDNPADHAEQDDTDTGDGSVPGRQGLDPVVDDSFYDTMSDDELRQQLDMRSIVYHPKAKTDKLRSLLRGDSVADPAGA